MPYFVTEPPKACEGITEELAEGICRDFPIELSTDEQTRYNLDLWECPEELAEFRNVRVDSQCSHYSLFCFQACFVPTAVNPPMIWVIQAVKFKFVGL